MLLCKDCDYYKCVDDPTEKESEKILADHKRGVCSYSGFVFMDDPDDLEIEYPCNQMKPTLSG